MASVFRRTVVRFPREGSENDTRNEISINVYTLPYHHCDMFTFDVLKYGFRPSSPPAAQLSQSFKECLQTTTCPGQKNIVFGERSISAELKKKKRVGLWLENERSCF
jgi:hypothetical protein